MMGVPVGDVSSNSWSTNPAILSAGIEASSAEARHHMADAQALKDIAQAHANDAENLMMHEQQISNLATEQEREAYAHKNNLNATVAFKGKVADMLRHLKRVKMIQANAATAAAVAAQQRAELANQQAKSIAQGEANFENTQLEIPTPPGQAAAATSGAKRKRGGMHAQHEAHRSWGTYRSGSHH